jgi:hypothetical protein
MTQLSVHTWWRYTGGAQVELHLLLTSALDGGKLLASCPGCFTHQKTASSTHSTGQWVDPGGLNVLEKTPAAAGIQTPDHLAHNLATTMTKLSQVLWHYPRDAVTKNVFFHF